MQEPQKVYVKYFENRPMCERTSNYQVARHWIDCNKKTVAVVEDEYGHEFVSDYILKMRISVPKAIIYTDSTSYELLRKTRTDKISRNPVFVIEDEKGEFKGNFASLEEAKMLLQAGRKVRGMYIEEGNCKVWTAPIKAVYLDAKMFETEAGIRYFLTK